MTLYRPLHPANMPSDLRRERAASLKLAIEDCHPSDAGQILAFALEELFVGAPLSCLQETLQADAAFWADCAAPPALHAYFAATLKQLGATALGEKARKRLFLTLWDGLSDADRLAFLRKVDPDGAFVRKAAA